MEYRLTNTPQNCPLKDKLNCQEESVVGLPSKHHQYLELREGLPPEHSCTWSSHLYGIPKKTQNCIFTILKDI